MNKSVLPRKDRELDREIDAMDISIKRKFVKELSRGSLGRADKEVGINDMWISARLMSRLMSPDYLNSIIGDAP